jgi:hypothetical protein
MPEQPSLESGYDFNEKLSKLENLIKDQYAINFALYVTAYYANDSMDNLTIEELLEEFKKQIK